MTLVYDKESNVLRRHIPITIGMFAAICPFFTFAQTAPAPQLFAVCASQANLPTVYFSGVLQGTKQAFAGFQGGFTEFLAQHYTYKGVVACLPTNTAANAQNFITTRSTALRNAKKIVVDTGWTQGGRGCAGGEGCGTTGNCGFQCCQRRTERKRQQRGRRLSVDERSRQSFRDGCREWQQRLRRDARVGCQARRRGEQ
jgi:hypothetical protein